MREILIINIFLSLFLVLPTITFSQGENNQVQNQNQVQTQNQGKEQQLRITTQEQESTQEGENQENNNQNEALKTIIPRSETARERINIVTKMVEQLFSLQEAKGKIGEQISQLAQEQNRAQQEIQKQLNLLNSRPNWLERIIGPNYKVLRNIKQQLEQNQLRIKQLEQIKTQLANQGDQNKIQQTIQAMIKQNTSLEEQLQAKEKIVSIFGWFLKLFSK